MQANIEAAGRTKDYKKFIEWNLEHPEDLYWKIVLEQNPRIYLSSQGSDSSLKSSEFSSATSDSLQLLQKFTTEISPAPRISSSWIYLDPEYTGKGYGRKHLTSLKRLPGIPGGSTPRLHPKCKAPGSLSPKLGMKVLVGIRNTTWSSFSSRDGVVLIHPLRLKCFNLFKNL